MGLSPEDRRLYLELEDWLDILHREHGHIVAEDLVVEIGSAVFDRLEELDVDTRLVFDPVLGGSFASLLEIPDFIREAYHLTVEEQAQLHFAQAPVASDVMDQAKHETIETLRIERQSHAGEQADRPSDPGYVLATFLAKVRSILGEEGQEVEAPCFDRTTLLNSFTNILGWCPLLREMTSHGRPVAEIFQERLEAFPTPELAIIRTLFDGATPSLVLGIWLNAIHSEATLGVGHPEVADALALHAEELGDEPCFTAPGHGDFT